MTRNIWHERNLLDKERRDLIDTLMRPYGEYFKQKRLEIMLACGEEGHNWRFTDVGPLGHVWFHCTKCGKSRIEDE